MTTLILALSLSRWQLHQEFLLEEKTECPPTDHRKTIPTSPPKIFHVCVCVPKNVFCWIQGCFLRLKTGGVKLKTMEKTFTFTFVGGDKRVIPVIPPANGRVGLLRHHRLCEELSPHGPWVTTIMQYHWHLPKSACFLTLRLMINVSKKKRGCFFLRDIFFGIFSGQNTLALQDLPLVFVLCCLELFDTYNLVTI